MVPDLAALHAREAVALLIRHVAEVIADSTFSRCIPALIEGVERDERLHEFHHRYSAERRQAIMDLIARGIQEGEISDAVDPRASNHRCPRRDLLSAVHDRKPVRPG